MKKSKETLSYEVAKSCIFALQDKFLTSLTRQISSYRDRYEELDEESKGHNYNVVLSWTWDEDKYGNSRLHVKIFTCDEDAEHKKLYAKFRFFNKYTRARDNSNVRIARCRCDVKISSDSVVTDAFENFVQLIKNCYSDIVTIERVTTSLKFRWFTDDERAIKAVAVLMERSLKTRTQLGSFNIEFRNVDGKLAAILDGDTEVVKLQTHERAVCQAPVVG